MFFMIMILLSFAPRDPRPVSNEYDDDDDFDDSDDW